MKTHLSHLAAWKFLFVGSLFLIPVLLVAEVSEEDLGAFCRPADTQTKETVSEAGAITLDHIQKVATFLKWKTFEDDRVKFRYPDHPSISLDIKRNDVSPPSDSDRASTINTSYKRSYSLVVGGKTYMEIRFHEATWMDDDTCFCGEIIYDRYLIREGNLYRFSFLKNGVMKSMQVLGDREKLMTFESTHLPIHPSVYRQISRSIELIHKGTWNPADCEKRVMEYGPHRFIGWFDESTPASEVEAKLGKSTRTEADGTKVWEYPKTEDGYRWTEKLILPFKEGKLVQFDSSFYDYARNDRQGIAR